MLHPELIHVPLIVVDPRRRPPDERLPGPDPRHRPHAAVARRRATRRTGMDGVDLSPLLRGQRPDESRKLRLSAATPTGTTPATTEWAYVSANSGRRPASLRPRPRPEGGEQHRPPSPQANRRPATSGPYRRAGRRPAGLSLTPAPPTARQNAPVPSDSPGARSSPARRPRSAAPFVSLGDRAGAQEPPNVLVIMVDTLRADHVYGDRARTPNMDELSRAGAVLHARVPEAMPTVPVRNGFLSGRRGFPFRGWHDYRRAASTHPAGSRSTTWRPGLDEPLQRAGYWTGYVTDNPFLGFSYSVRPLRRSVRPVPAARRPGRRHRPGRLRQRVLDHWLHPRSSGAEDRRPRCGATWPTGATRATRARPSPAGCSARASRPSSGRAQPAAVRAGRRHLRAARAVDPAAPLHRPLRRPRLARPGARHAALRRVSKLARSATKRARVLERLRALYAAEVTMTDHWIGVLLERLHAARASTARRSSCSSPTTASSSASAAGPGRSRSRCTPSSSGSRS